MAPATVTAVAVSFSIGTIFVSVESVAARPASFAYSADGKKFLPIGNELKMGLGWPWTANRFALFNFSTSAGGVGGCADFNWFHFKGEIGLS